MVETHSKSYHAVLALETVITRTQRSDRIRKLSVPCAGPFASGYAEYPAPLMVRVRARTGAEHRMLRCCVLYQCRCSNRSHQISEIRSGHTVSADRRLYKQSDIQKHLCGPVARCASWAAAVTPPALLSHGLYLIKSPRLLRRAGAKLCIKST
jgi:hypothetical protein